MSGPPKPPGYKKKYERMKPREKKWLSDSKKKANNKKWRLNIKVTEEMRNKSISKLSTHLRGALRIDLLQFVLNNI